jgi:dihydrofolate synthase/folylpolyglutamate synthase
MIFAALKSKDAHGLLAPFIGIAVHVHTLPIKDHDCRSPEDLAVLAKELDLEASPHRHLQDALKSIPADVPVLVFGSLYLAGEALAANRQYPD